MTNLPATITPNYEGRMLLLSDGLIKPIIENWQVPDDLVNDTDGQHKRLTKTAELANRCLPTDAEKSELETILKESINQLLMTYDWKAWPSIAKVCKAVNDQERRWRERQQRNALPAPTKPKQEEEFKRHPPQNWSREELAKWDAQTEADRRNMRPGKNMDGWLIDARERIADVARQAQGKG